MASSVLSEARADLDGGSRRPRPTLEGYALGCLVGVPYLDKVVTQPVQ